MCFITFVFGLNRVPGPETARSPKSRQVNKRMSDKLLRDFPGGPAIRASYFYLQGQELHPWSEAYSPMPLWCSQEKKKKKKAVIFLQKEYKEIVTTH